MSVRNAVLLLGLLVLAGSWSQAGAGTWEGVQAPSHSRFGDLLPEKYATWVEGVLPIIAGDELATFLRLREDYQRDAFIERFWRVRDPYPETPRNEMRERYERRLAYVRANYESFDDARARLLLVHGEPDQTLEVRCTTTRVPALVWAYHRSEQVNFGFVVVLVRDKNGTGLAKLWRPRQTGELDGIVRNSRACINGEILAQLVSQLQRAGSEYALRLDRVLMKPQPRSHEWVQTFSAESTDLPPDAATFEASRLAVDYLGRYQNRVVVQAALAVPREAVTLGDLAGYRSHDLLLLGEVLDEDGLLERFRYKFGFLEDSQAGPLSLVFQRYLRPGEYQLRLLIKDLSQEQYHRVVQTLEVPALANAYTPASGMDSETSTLFRDATYGLDQEGPSLRLLPASQGIQTGFVRFDTLATGPIDRVVFSLNGQEVLTKTRPPFNVELDLGPFPRLHRVEAAAYDAEGKFLVADAIEVNAGGERFSVQLVEPRPSEHYQGNVLARANVRVPDGATLDRVEFFVNERLAATLYQAPFRQPLTMPSDHGLAYVRTVAYLVDGDRCEDHVYVNAPSTLEEVDIQFVELYTAVTDHSGRPLVGLGSDQFTVLEDGKQQKIDRFELVSDLPIHVGVVMDNSASMRPALRGTREAALRFFEQAISERDRAALITFNRFPHLAVKLTNDHRLLGGGLAGLTAEGQTALYDSLMFALYYFTGVSGQRAILLLSDGKDEVSRFSFDETLEYARRAGVTVYVVGLKIGGPVGRSHLTQLANETGGRSFFINDVDDLGPVYDAIQSELRAQYLIAYQSSNTSTDDAFRAVQVKVGVPDADVKTMSGYYP